MGLRKHNPAHNTGLGWSKRGEGRKGPLCETLMSAGLKRPACAQRWAELGVFFHSLLCQPAMLSWAELRVYNSMSE